MDVFGLNDVAVEGLDFGILIGIRSIPASY